MHASLPCMHPGLHRMHACLVQTRMSGANEDVECARVLCISPICSYKVAYVIDTISLSAMLAEVRL